MYFVFSICKFVVISEVCCMVVVLVMSSDFWCFEKLGILWNFIGIYKFISKIFRKNFLL